MFDTVRTEKTLVMEDMYVTLEKAKMALATRLLSLDSDSVTTKDAKPFCQRHSSSINQNYEQTIGF